MRRLVFLRPRLLGSALVGSAVGFASPAGAGATFRLLIGWDTTVVLWLGLILVMIVRSDHDRMQSRADDEDAGAVAILVLTVVAAVASLAAIVAELSTVSHGQPGGSGKAAAIGLAAGTILASWLFVHAAFAIHYAHDFYAGADDRRGLAFPKTERPDYWDFVYFSFNLGAAAQTSDVQVEARRMRRLVLAHTVLSFLFNTTVLALAVNVGASLI